MGCPEVVAFPGVGPLAAENSRRFTRLPQGGSGESGKIGRAVLAVALVAATVMLVLTVGSLIGLIVQRNFRGEPTHDREAFHTAPQPPEHAQP